MLKCAKKRKKVKTDGDAGKRAFSAGVDGANRNKVPAERSKRRSAFRQPKTELEQAILRYVDLFNFAPIGYVTFDRVGRIEEINFAAIRLLGRSRKQLFGITFAVCVAKEDTQLFLNHLLACRSSDRPAVTELKLKRPDGEKIPVLLSSTATFGLMKDGARLYQTAIVDLTQHKHAEEARSEAIRKQAALYELSRRYQGVKTSDQIYDAALDAILTALRCDRASILLYDQHQVMRFVAWRGLSKGYRKAVEGHSPWKPDAKNPQPVCIADVDLADLPRSLRSTVRTEGIRAVAFVPLLSSQKLVGKFMIYHNAPHPFTDEELKLATTIATQLVQAIQHKRDEDALREREAELELIVTQTPFMLTRCSRDLRYCYVSRAYADMLGRKPEEIAGKPIVQIMGKEGLKAILPHIEKVLKGQTVEYEMEVPFVGVGAPCLYGVYTPDRDAKGNVVGWFASITDVTRRKDAEAALQKSKQLLEQRVRKRTRELHLANKELKAEIARRKGLEGEILAVSDREQQRLGQELHDGLCQHLAAVAFMARSVALRLKDHRVIDAADIEKIAQLVNDAATDTRNLSRALHRLDVDSAGLVDALQDLVDREIWRTACRLEVKPSFRIEDDIAAAQLYRIAREAVINANKHAQAREIVVKLEGQRQKAVLRVIDDGIGVSDEPKLSKGLGFHIMNYRAQVLGGRLEIDCPKGGGTCISCYLPNHAPRKSRERETRQSQRVLAKSMKALAAVI
jgi:PAS domain S-box-containing protein